jgi:Na+-driven multidrug efflux pump
VVTFIVRANGTVIGPLVILIISGVGVRFAIGFGLHPHYGADAIWWAFIGAGIASFVLSLAYYFHGGWRKLNVFGARPLDVEAAPAV